MLDLLLAVAAAALLTALALALLSAVTLVPFVVALSLAERRRFSAGRWGSVTLAGAVGGLLLAGLLLSGDRVPAPVAVLPLLLGWTGPAALRLLSAQDTAVGGRAGRHEG